MNATALCRIKDLRECATEAASIARRHDLDTIAADADHIFDALWMLDPASPAAPDVVGAAHKHLGVVLDSIEAHLVALEPA